ncbi:MAG: glycosyltransferase [Chitinophagales bacterium]
MKKNILYICTPDSIHDQKWMRYFADQKNEFAVFAIGETQNHKSETRQQLLADNITLLDSIETFSISHPIDTLTSIVRLNKIIKEYNIHVVHVLFAAPYALWINFITIPSIITTRGSDILVVIPELLSHAGLKGIYFKLLFNLFRRSFKKAKYITCTSSKQIEKVNELFQVNNSVLIKTGVEVEAIDKIDKPELLNTALKNKSYVFSPRFMSPIYNIHYQIEALALLDKSIIEKYVFVFTKGKNFDAHYYKKQLESLALLKDSIKLNFLVLDYLDQESLWMHLKNAALVLMTPISDGTPNSALETMAAKTPLIISDLPLYDVALFGNACIYVPLNKAHNLANEITMAINEYPPNLIQTAYNNVILLGNRNIEMNKLANLYLTIK